MDKSEYLTVRELADILGISRVTVFRKIKEGKIPAVKIGRNFIIYKKDIPEILGDELSDKIKAEIDIGIKKVVREYSETLKLLGRE
ncbi:MAG: helix-turn-helix domain-containing protein [Patescibacteria group bacterium]